MNCFIIIVVCIICLHFYLNNEIKLNSYRVIATKAASLTTQEICKGLRTLRAIIGPFQKWFLFANCICLLMQRTSMLKAKILPKTPREFKSNLEGVEINIY